MNRDELSKVIAAELMRQRDQLGDPSYLDFYDPLGTHIDGHVDLRLVADAVLFALGGVGRKIVVTPVTPLVMDPAEVGAKSTPYDLFGGMVNVLAAELKRQRDEARYPGGIEWIDLDNMREVGVDGRVDLYALAAVALGIDLA